MKNISVIGFLVVTISIMILASPASAVLLEQTFKGSISRMDSSTGTIYVNVANVYEGNGNWITYAKSSLPNNIVSGTFSNPSAFNDLKQGDPVEATIMGGSEWITIGKIASAGLTSSPIMNSYGDPSRLVSPFYKGYIITFETVADCDLCEGTTCTASMASVTVMRDSLGVETADLTPGSTHVFGWENVTLQYVPQVTFVSGEASSSECSLEGEIMIGPQAISDFTIYITQRSTILGSMTEEATNVATETTLTTSDVTEVSTQPTTSAAPITTTSPGFSLLCTIGAIFAALFLVSRRMK